MKTFKRTRNNSIYWLWGTLVFGVIALLIMWLLRGRPCVHRLLSSDRISVSPIMLSNSDQSVITGPLRVDPANLRYFTDGNGKAIFLTGSHTWDNFQDMGSVVSIIRDIYRNFKCTTIIL